MASEPVVPDASEQLRSIDQGRLRVQRADIPAKCLRDARGRHRPATLDEYPADTDSVLLVHQWEPLFHPAQRGALPDDGDRDCVVRQCQQPVRPGTGRKRRRFQPRQRLGERLVRAGVHRQPAVGRRPRRPAGHDIRPKRGERQLHQHRRSAHSGGYRRQPGTDRERRAWKLCEDVGPISAVSPSHCAASTRPRSRRSTTVPTASRVPLSTRSSRTVVPGRSKSKRARAPALRQHRSTASERWGWANSRRLQAEQQQCL